MIHNSKQERMLYAVLVQHCYPGHLCSSWTKPVKEIPSWGTCHRNRKLWQLWEGNRRRAQVKLLKQSRLGERTGHVDTFLVEFLRSLSVSHIHDSQLFILVGKESRNMVKWKSAQPFLKEFQVFLDVHLIWRGIHRCMPERKTLFLPFFSYSSIPTTYNTVQLTSDAFEEPQSLSDSYFINMWFCNSISSRLSLGRTLTSGNQSARRSLTVKSPDLGWLNQEKTDSDQCSSFFQPHILLNLHCCINTVWAKHPATRLWRTNTARTLQQEGDAPWQIWANDKIKGITV